MYCRLMVLCYRQACRRNGITHAPVGDGNVKLPVVVRGRVSRFMGLPVVFGAFTLTYPLNVKLAVSVITVRFIHHRKAAVRLPVAQNTSLRNLLWLALRVYHTKLLSYMLIPLNIQLPSF